MFFRRLNWNVVSWFRTVSFISYAVIFAGLVMMGYNWFTKGYPIKLGLSFTGGTDVTVKYTAPATTAQIRQALATVGVSDAQINTVGKSGDAVPNERYTISTQSDFGDTTSKLWGALGTVAPVDRSQSSIESVGPSLSHEYLIKALWALFIAIGIQFVYIAFRFGWNIIFGEVVVIALVRDALMMIGIYALAQKRADDAFLAAVLTVIGYSVMDTIVILDRIRENVKVMAGESYDKIVNTSILQTMTRSFNTLATVVITLVALLAFGGGSLQNFAFALLVGICSGGYHSIFYSAPLVYVLREREMRKAGQLRDQQRVTALDKPRTVAEARAQAASGLTREQVIAARKERRSREKQAPARVSGGPARYKRKRSSPATAAEIAADEAAGIDGEYDGEYEQFETLDPLDAQNAGVHDSDLALGHEEIHLNLDGEGEAAPLGTATTDHGTTDHGTVEGETPATVKHD